MNSELEYVTLEAVYDVLYSIDGDLRRVTADHTAIVKVIEDVLKRGLLIKVEMN